MTISVKKEEVDLQKMSRRPHYCYYHSRFREEASKCKTSENEPKCEFQKLNEGIDKKPIQDLRSHIRTDLRKSLKTDLRVHLNKRNQRTVSKAKQPIQDLRSRLSRPRVADQTEKEEGYLYMRRADMEEDVEEENLFTRKSDEENYVIHVSEAQEEEPNSSRDLMSEANEYCVYSSEGSTYENITRTIKNDYYFDRPLDEIVGDRYRRACVKEAVPNPIAAATDDNIQEANNGIVEGQSNDGQRQVQSQKQKKKEEEEDGKKRSTRNQNTETYGSDSE